MGRAIIVGATSGIGRGLAKLLVDDGFYVGITGRRSDLLTEIKNENPNKYMIKSFDITDTDKIPNHLEDLVRDLGGLDILILCSGTGEINKKLDFVIEKRTINTSVALFLLIVL